jgi:hypothetical protein
MRYSLNFYTVFYSTVLPDFSITYKSSFFLSAFSGLGSFITYRKRAVTSIYYTFYYISISYALILMLKASVKWSFTTTKTAGNRNDKSD